MTANELAGFITELIEFEKENGDFQENLENEDWDALKDEIYEYLVDCDQD